MHPMRSFISLTRPLNLVIIVLTMVTMRYGLLNGVLKAGGWTLQLGTLNFVLLVASTVLIAAGGNVINDYFDTRIDRINKPGAVIVGRTVKRRIAMAGHLVLSGIGLVLGAWVAWQAGSLRWVAVPAFAIGALWTYSTSFKRRFIIGNGLVATLTALVPFLVGLYEIPLLERHYTAEILSLGATPEQARGFFTILWAGIGIFTVFAFATTLVRELQKDLADMKGDEADGCRTVPIVLGERWAKILVLFYAGCISVGVWVVYDRFLSDSTSFWLLGVGVVLPILASAVLTATANTRKEHLLAGHVMKAAMVVAIGFAWTIGTLLGA
jgi:4-hydroxybenzoate polyprenyltransferase